MAETQAVSIAGNVQGSFMVAVEAMTAFLYVIVMPATAPLQDLPTFEQEANLEADDSLTA